MEQTLEVAAQAFADELTQTFRGVLGSSACTFVAEAGPTRADSGETRIVVRTSDQKPVRLTIDATAALDLEVTFRCTWDHRGTYLAVKKSSWKVIPAGFTEPLLRYEFDSSQGGLPAAHLHIHGHRDEFVYLLFRSTQRSKQKSRAKVVAGDISSKAYPRLSNLHFPLGGTRMRPCIEDLLQFLIVEFGIDAVDGHQDVIERGREEWRRRQIRVCVRDAPEEAVRVLEELGYSVDEPNDGASASRREKLIAP
ncbi:MAG: hypothetical protein ACRCYU_10950 [Nocardioides sp.]